MFEASVALDAIRRGGRGTAGHWGRRDLGYPPTRSSRSAEEQTGLWAAGQGQGHVAVGLGLGSGVLLPGRRGPVCCGRGKHQPPGPPCEGVARVRGEGPEGAERKRGRRAESQVATGASQVARPGSPRPGSSRVPRSDWESSVPADLPRARPARGPQTQTGSRLAVSPGLEALRLPC